MTHFETDENVLCVSPECAIPASEQRYVKTVNETAIVELVCPIHLLFNTGDRVDVVNKLV